MIMWVIEVSEKGMVQRRIKEEQIATVLLDLMNLGRGSGASDVACGSDQV